MELCVESLAGAGAAHNPSWTYQVVWECAGTQGQTEPQYCDEAGDVPYGGRWFLPPGTVGGEPLDVAVWAYPAEGEVPEGDDGAQHIGVATLALPPPAEVAEEQRHALPVDASPSMMVVVALAPAGVAADPATAPEAAAAAAAAPAASSADGDAAGLVSLRELRHWVDGVLAHAAPGAAGGSPAPSPAASPSLRPAAAACPAIAPEPALLRATLRPLLDVAAGGADTRTPSTPAQAVEERLVAGIVDVFAHCCTEGPAMARGLRAETERGLRDLLRLPARCAARPFSGNAPATLRALHAMQHAAAPHAAAPGHDHQRRAMLLRRLVVYVSEDTYLEWGDLGIDALIAHSMPLLLLRRVDNGQDGCMDLTQLEQLLEDDATQNCVPAGVVARVGSEGAGGCDDLTFLTALCERLGLWLHCEGPATYLLGAGWDACDAIRAAAERGTVSVSVTVCEDEVPGLRKLPGFWLFTARAGPGGGGADPVPCDDSAESDLTALRTVLPLYLRLRGGGSDGARELLRDRFAEADALAGVLAWANERARGDTGSAVPRAAACMLTDPGNRWSIRFTLTSSDHPLMRRSWDAGEPAPDAGDLGALAAQPAPSGVTLGRLRTINSTASQMLAERFPGGPGVALGEDDGVPVWSYSIADDDAAAEPGAAAYLRELIVGACENIVGVSLHAERVCELLRGVPNLDVVPRPVAGDFELAAFRLVPLFYEAQGELGEGDLADISDINRSLFAHLTRDEAEAGGAAVYGLVEEDGHVVITASLTMTRELTVDEVIGISREVQEGVDWVLHYDETVHRLEADLIRRGIAVAERQLQEARDASEQERGALRGVPIVGGVMDWLLPVAGQHDEGLRFDLTTSTLQKEGRTEPGAVKADAPAG